MTNIHIGDIRVRAANLTPAQGQQLGERIAALLTDQLAGSDVARRDVGHLQARVTVQGGETVDQLAAQVVKAIIEGM
jgi:hypothetical protein